MPPAPGGVFVWHANNNNATTHTDERKRKMPVVLSEQQEKNETETDNHLSLKLGLVANLGATIVSARSVEELIAFDPAAVLIAGGLSYADGFSPRWDAFGRMIEPLAARYPLLHVPGDHEFGFGFGRAAAGTGGSAGGHSDMIEYTARWLSPYRSSGSWSRHVWSTEIGAVHIIGLNAYEAADKASAQVCI
jgi:hypothetical protein